MRLNLAKYKASLADTDVLKIPSQFSKNTHCPPLCHRDMRVNGLCDEMSLAKIHGSSAVGQFSHRLPHVQSAIGSRRNLKLFKHPVKQQPTNSSRLNVCAKRPSPNASSLACLIVQRLSSTSAPTVDVALARQRDIDRLFHSLARSRRAFLTPQALNVSPSQVGYLHYTRRSRARSSP